MKLSKATTFLTLYAAFLLAALPSDVHGQSISSLLPSSNHPATTTSARATTTTTTVPVTNNPPTQTHTTPAQKTTTVASSANRLSTNTQSALPTTTTSLPIPSNSDTCVNSSTCAEGLVCAATNGTAGTCQQFAYVCQSSPALTCVTSADCPLAFSLCTDVEGQRICAGRGIPGTTNECKDPKDSSLQNTLKYAGIAVGSVAAFAVVFALVRWKRRRQRSGVPAEMFGEVDYGMADRNGSSKPVENYPFSSRPNAHGSDYAPSPFDYNGGGGGGGGGGRGYDDQYYAEPVGYNNMHSGKVRQDQYYGHNQYDNNQYSGGYDHRNDGFYDHGGYDGYQHHPTSPAPVARTTSSRHQNSNTMDNYGAEPSELDFGGHGRYGGGGRY
ncbi:hypothetical protein BX616_002423 [Lobosporangium transversale]|uniref:Uncharacterized protein n=1 Tax=Lobosporangium transversale TaxID=64571 RepID=A0A1Y2GNS1_9FUNG|nr:hypothetical protein BCR41DRAFT_352982 [Lobosporangium transversale]KAF9900995.1 hypothetical protein BX616_002423 [Lobosporangium transversale]ORZ16698.1 hypothetical protein BCR41DRAFT_352982 [Lobosporangium transversale]|eukprot:XP_021881633.1 hypothetical protein BCR41DRAFT_352982 [Lobosporangium transversale]